MAPRRTGGEAAALRLVALSTSVAPSDPAPTSSTPTSPAPSHSAPSHPAPTHPAPTGLTIPTTPTIPTSSTIPTRSLVLTREERARTRFRATLGDGAVALVLLPRGSVVRPGSRLVAESGEVVEVIAAAEAVYRVSATADSRDPAFDLQRAAYHLGNRHVPVELGAGCLKIERDPVLRDLLLRLDMQVASAFEAFDPEPGAYGGGHRHDSDVEGGATGEELSRNAHASASSRTRPLA